MRSIIEEVTPRKRLTVGQRQRLLARYHRSPLTQAEFAAKHGIGLSTLGKWLREARAGDAAPPPVRFQEMALPSLAPRWAVELVSSQGEWHLLRDQEHTKLPLKAESLYPTMAGRLNATAAFQAPAFLGRKV